MATFSWMESSQKRMVRAVLLALAIALGAMPGMRAQAPTVDLIAILETYAAGRPDEAVAKAAAFKELGPLRLQFVQRAPAWIAADPAASAHRRAVVAGFVVELAAARLEDDWGRLSDLIEFTCAQILRTAPPSEFERSWHMATTALAGRARVRQWLLGPYARLPHMKPRKELPDDPPSPKHLTHALERFPEDPQFQLARVVAWTWGRDAEPTRNTGDREFGRVSRPPQLDALMGLEPLQAIPAVASEAFIRAGLVHVTLRDHAAALKAFAAARPGASTTQVKYLSHFLAGRSLEALNRQDDAAAEYRAALALVPLAESATVALAGLHFMRGDNDDAVKLVDDAFAKTSTTTDPGRLTGYGAFLYWPEIKAAMRAEIKK